MKKTFASIAALGLFAALPLAAQAHDRGWHGDRHYDDYPRYVKHHHHHHHGHRVYYPEPPVVYYPAPRPVIAPVMIPVPPLPPLPRPPHVSVRLFF